MRAVKKISTVMYKCSYGIVYKDDWCLNGQFSWVAETKLSHKKYAHFATKNDAILFLKKAFKLETELEDKIIRVLEDFDKQNVYNPW